MAWDLDSALNSVVSGQLKSEKKRMQWVSALAECFQHILAISNQR